jgi:hypothetical protein
MTLRRTTLLVKTIEIRLSLATTLSKAGEGFEGFPGYDPNSSAPKGQPYIRCRAERSAALGTEHDIRQRSSPKRTNNRLVVETAIHPRPAVKRASQFETPVHIRRHTHVRTGLIHRSDPQLLSIIRVRPTTAVQTDQVRAAKSSASIRGIANEWRKPSEKWTNREKTPETRR